MKTVRDPTKNSQLFGNVWLNVDTFYERVTKHHNGCWIYNGPKHVQGYGMISIVHDHNRKFGIATAHRLAMKMKLKTNLARHDYVLHTCKNPACVNPDHLYLGDHREMNAQRRSWKWKTHE